jgi:hypothetical protein
MAQLAEMGIAIPEEFRGDMAMAGEWQTVSRTQVKSDEVASPESSIQGAKKRKHDDDDEEEPMAGQKGWLGKQKAYRESRAADDEDLDALLSAPIKLKQEAKEEDITVKKEEPGVDSKTLDLNESSTQEPLVKMEDSTTENKDSEPPPAAPSTGIVFKKRKAKTAKPV